MKFEMYSASHSDICLKHSLEHTLNIYTKTDNFTQKLVCRAPSNDEVRLLVIHIQGPLWTI